MRSRSARLLAPTVLALALVGAGLSSATAVVAPETTIKPASLERGDNPGVPQLLGKTILDGDRRIKVPGREVQLLGTSGDDYVVLVYPKSGSSRVQRVAADGSRETIMKGVAGDVVLSADGDLVLEALTKGSTRTVVVVRDAETGEREARRVFRGYLRVLDADNGRAILGGSSPARTLRWNTRTGGTEKIAGREGYFADIRADRFATIRGTGENLCSVLSSLPPKAEILWHSCRRAVVAASPNGRRVMTTQVYADGPTSFLSMRGDHGRVIADYGIDGSFGGSTFETNRAVLIEAFGTNKTAIVRCVVDNCERASRRIDSQ